MASKKKQRGMVSHQEGAPAPAAAPAGDHPPTRFVAPKPGKASEGGMERSPGVTSDEADAKPTMYPSKEASRTAGGLQSDNLSPDSICKGIRVTLDNNSMWNDFFRSKTEMILTKQGSRMFPYCRFRISGLQPSRKYSLIMDIQPLDNSHYKWTGKSWQVAGKAECHVKSQPFAHPESPSMGRHWMQSPVSFYKLKLTNDTADQEGNTILHPMHRYLPRLHVVQTDKAAKDIKLTGPSVVTFTFPQTEFMAVTAYQNSRFAQLKVDYNPFSKGLKEDGSTSRGLKLNSSKDSHKDGGTTTNEQHPFKKSLKSLLANYKPRSSKPADSKPSTSGDLQKNSTTNKDQLAAKATEECPCTSRPTQKLFSELIREAHVSLQRCNLEQLGINNSSSHRTERTNTKTTASTAAVKLVPRRNATTVPPDVLVPIFIWMLMLLQKQFFSTNDDLGMGVDFSNTEAVAAPCPPPNTAETNAHEVSQQVQPVPASKLGRHKKSRQRKLAKTDLDQKMDDSAYTSMQPKLEEVEEQLFISFTSKEALKLHVVDSSEETQPRMTPEDHLQRTTVTPENELLSEEIKISTEILRVGSDSGCGSDCGSDSDYGSDCGSDPDSDCGCDCGCDSHPDSDPDSGCGSDPDPDSDCDCDCDCDFSTDEVVDVGGSSLPDGLSPQNFPAKLWRMVNNPATKAISWDSRGEVVLIDQHLFERQILSASSATSDTADAFKTTNFSSFVRQLHLYGFRKAEPACKDKHRPAGDSGTCYRFYNPNFKRSHPELVPSLRRLTVNNKAKIQTGLTVNCRSQHKRLSEDEDGGHDEDKTAETLQETIAAFEKVLLRDLRLMRHRQVIHPVLQEVGLKMNLLDSSLAIDLQYLGVSLPLPPPGVCVEPPPPQGVCAAFVSRTGKTTDMTQIKGWRQKFSPSEAPPTVALPNPEAGPGPDSSPSPSPGPGPVPGPGPAPDVVQKKNLSAFCSDMLDQYLESEGKLIDQRASSFSQTLLEPPVYEPVYELPTRSSSYVRTLDSVLKKQPGPALDLISGFVPPSKRPKLSLKETRTSRRPRLPKPHRPRQEPAPADSNPVPTQPAVQGPDSLQNPTVRTRRRRLKPKTSSKTLSPHRSTAPPSGVSEDLAPLESDSELGTLLDQRDETSGMDGRPGPVMTRTLLRQKDLEDGAVWEGKTRTSITEERAAIALTSLFTLQGFVRENPTAPIQLVRRCAPPCLNEFCRLGCVCSSLSHCSRISHCGRPPCMFRCSCLKQKVVLLKNLDGSDSSPSQLANNRKKRRRRRMKMAYILKEADNVSQPAERVRTLWKTDTGDSDPDPVHVPEPAPLSRTSRSDDHSSCARVRGFKQTKTQKIQRDKQKKVKLIQPLETLNDVKTSKRLKHLKHRDLTLKDTKTKPFCPLAGNPVSQPPSSSSTRPPSPPSEAVGPKPSKRLIILAECKWVVEADRNQVLKELCERMAWDQLDEPFWIKNYLISPMGQTVEGTGTGSDHCIQYKIHISTPKLEPDRPVRPVRPEKPVKVKPEKQVKVKPEKQVKVKPEKPVKVKPVKPEKPVRPAQPGTRKRRKQSETPGFEQEHLKQVSRGAEPPEDYLREVKEEAEPLEAWQREVEEEEAGPLEDWQREVEDDDMDEEEAAVSTADQVHDRTESIKEEVRIPQKKKKKKMVRMALPFLTGISPAGFLSANKKQPGGTDQLIQVNKKLYPLAKIQLGKMGALHPANRLAAYLTGRVGSNRKQQAASSSLSTDRPQNQNRSSGLPPVPVSGPTVAPPRSQPAVTLLALPTPPTVVQPPPVKVVQSAASSDPPAGSRVVTVMVYPQAPTGGANQIRVLPAASGSSAPTKASQVVSPVAPPPKASQLLLLHVPPPRGKVPVAAPPPLSSSSSSSLGQRVLLQPVPSSSPSGQRVVAPPPSSSGQRVVAPPPSSPGQRVLLQPVQTASGLQYFRKPDGKLVQLVPISQLKSLNQNQNQAVHRGSLSPSVVPPASRQTPVVTVLNQTPPMTSLSSSSSLSSSFSSSSSPLRPPSGTCTFKLLPSGSSKDPIIITCPKVPSRPPTRLLTAPTSLTLLKPVPPSLPSSSPLNLISLKPSVGQGAELGVKTLTVSPGGLLVHQTPATTPPHRPKSPAPPPADESPTEPEPARDLVDLDIVCVDDETGLVVEETVGREAQSLDVAEREASASSETENSSDFGDETESEGETKTDVSVKTNRLLHNVLEKRRRLKLQRLFEALGREVGLSDEKTSKIRTLRTAVQVIEQLRTTETNLQEKKRRLTKTRDDFLSIIAPTGKSSRCLRSPDRGQTGRPMDAVDLLDETDELTENSSDEDRLVTTTTDVSTVTNEDEVQCVDVETLEDSGRLDAAQRTNVDSESSLSVAAQSVTAAFRALRSVLNAEDAPETLLLHRAREEIETLQRETDRLMSLKTKLNQQRDIFIRDVSQRSGKSEQVILRKLHHLSSKQRQMERRHGAANQLPAAAGDGASHPPAGDTTDDEVIITSFKLNTQAPPTPVPAPPTSTPAAPPTSIPVHPPAPPAVPTGVPTAVHQAQTHRVLQVSHGASEHRDRPKTVPNILSRRKTPALPASSLESPSFQALLPAEVLSLVSTPSPGQQVMTLSPLMAAPTVLQTSSSPGVASVTLNIPSLTNQQIHLTSLPRPPTGKIYSSSAPLTMTDLTATNFTNLLQLLHTSPQQQTPAPQQQDPPCTSVVSAGSDISSDPIRDQTTPESCSLTPPPASGQSSDVTERESLSSLLDEIVFLNQQPVTTATPPSPGEEPDDAHSPWLLQLDSDSDDTVTMETDEAGLNDYAETAEAETQPGPANGITTGCSVVAPPPLLQMKAGGAKVADPGDSGGASGGGGAGGGGGAWRPMPRLVPLGLRGAPPS
ncbi:MAX dimerization protein MGA a [Symphorus nematophorus]